MTVKCVGAEFKRFYNDPEYWVSPERSPDDYTWHDDGMIAVNDVEQPYGIEVEKLNDTDRVSINGGVVFGQVVGPKEPSLENYFKRWRKAQNTTSIVVDCPKEKLDAILAAIKASGGSVQQ